MISRLIHAGAVYAQEDDEALVLVHVDSLTSYEQDTQDQTLAQRMVDAVRQHQGLTVAVSQGWKEGHSDVEQILRLADEVINFDEDTQKWGDFIEEFDDLLGLYGVSRVRVGGIWYDPKGEHSCATYTLTLLRERGYDAWPDETILGCTSWNVNDEG